MQEFDRIKDLIYDELEELSHVDRLSKEVVCVIGELVDILKDMGTIEMFEDGDYAPDDEYSLANSYARGGSSQRSYSRGNSYNNGNSYRGGRGGSGYSRRGGRGYSRADGKEHMIEKLEHLMNEAQSEADRVAIKKLIDQMDND